jgi:uncharacterized protein
MTPQEQKLVAELFDRLASLEDRKRDPEAERVIADGLQRAPNAIYALVQTVLVQDEALRNADARIREMQGGTAGGGGFLDTMRDSLFGGREPARGSVPPVRPDRAPMGVPPGFRAGAAPDRPEPQQAGSQGGSFLGTAAAAAAGVIGGALLLDGIRSMMGGGHGATSQPAAAGNFGDSNTPLSGSGSGDLSREAGIDHVGRGGRDRADTGDRPEETFDTAQAEIENDDIDLDFDISDLA